MIRRLRRGLAVYLALGGAVLLAAGLAGPAAGASQAASPQWRVQSPELPSGTLSSYLDQVSCASAAACMAVGNYQSFSGVYRALALTWNGSHWTARALPAATTTDLYGVSCRSAAWCTAVGIVTDSSGDLVPLAEHWNGAAWSRQAAPLPAGASYGYLASVSCPATSACTAAGFTAGTSGYEHPLIERWNGTRWQVQSAPGPAGKLTVSRLTGVSCPSATACRAVGYDASTGFSEIWNGAAWKLRPISLPSGGSSAELAGISCPSAGDCTAVGTFDGGSHYIPLSESWNGSAWSARKPPVPATSTATSLAGAACVSAGDCEAAGQAAPAGTGQEGLIERWNGSVWGVQDKVLPAGATTAELSGMSCAAGPVCEAVGREVVSATGEQQVLVLRYAR